MLALGEDRKRVEKSHARGDRRREGDELLHLQHAAANRTDGPLLASAAATCRSRPRAADGNLAPPAAASSRAWDRAAGGRLLDLALLSQADVIAGVFYVLAGGFGGYAVSSTELLRFGNVCWLVGSLISGTRPCLAVSSGMRSRRRTAGRRAAAYAPKSVELEAEAVVSARRAV